MLQSPVDKAILGSKPLPPAQDWELLVTEGHVLGERVKRAGALVFVPALALFMTFLYLTFPVAGRLLSKVGVHYGPQASFTSYVYRPIQDGRILPAWVYSGLMSDPNTYTDLGGGVRMAWPMKWLESLPRQPGTTIEAYSGLVRAVQSDLASFGRNKDKWTATSALKPSPRLTKADLFASRASELGTGLVVFPADPKDEQHPLLAAAYVAGQLAITIVGPAGCSTMTGPVASGCQPYQANSAFAQSVISTLKPRQ